MEGVKILNRSPEELPGVEGVERMEGDDGNRGGPPRPGGLRNHRKHTALYNRRGVGK
jgi:hypothetical protein